MDFRIELGDRVKDQVHGFDGVAVGRAQYLSGCNVILVQPTVLKDGGDVVEPRWIDEPRLEHVTANGKLMPRLVLPRMREIASPGGADKMPPAR